MLRIVTSYDQYNGINWQADIQQLLKLFKHHTMQRNNKSSINFILTLHVRDNYFIFIENPLPLLVGASDIIVTGNMMEQENETVIAISSYTSQQTGFDQSYILEKTNYF